MREYPEITSCKKWEREMLLTLKGLNKNDKQHFYCILVSLENTAKNCVKNGLFSYDDEPEFWCPLDNGEGYSFVFKKDRTDISYLNLYREKSKKVNSYTSSHREDNFSRSETQRLKHNGIRVGYHRPERFVKFFLNAKPGETITFENGASYVISKVDGDTVYFKKANIKGLCPEIDDFDKEKSYRINVLDGQAVQHIYNSICDNMTQGPTGRFTTDNEVNAILSKYYRLAEDEMVDFYFGKSEKKDVQIGRNHLLLQYNKHKKKFSWFDLDGNHIAEDKVRSLIGWYKTSPVQTIFKRDEKNYLDKISDNEEKDKINSLYRKKKFKEAFNRITDYCTSEKSSLAVNINAYAEEKGKFKATSFVFQYSEKTQDVRAYRVFYENNDFKDTPKDIEEISAETFEKFCNKAFANSVIFCLDECVKEMNKPYEVTEQGKMLLTPAAEKRAKEKLNERDLEKQLSPASPSLDAVISAIRAKSEAEDEKENKTQIKRKRDEYEK